MNFQPVGKHVSYPKGSLPQQVEEENSRRAG